MTRNETAEQSIEPADSRIKHSDSLAYWNSISPDVNGMLGGYPQISRVDLQGSINFIRKISRLMPPRVTRRTSSGNTHGDDASAATMKKLSLGVDCGAGIGRVTEGCLTHVCEVVDIVEPVAKFADVLNTSSARKEGQLGEIFVTGLETWQPPTETRYDLIWNQWCLGHLTDAQLERYFSTIKESLAEDGWIGVKENMSTRFDSSDIFDEVDSSVTRSDANFRRIFEVAGLKIVRTEIQSGFPRGLGLYPVRMYALKPR